MTPISRRDYEAKMTAQADRDFSGHVIRGSDDWRWTIGTPDGSSIYWACICVPSPRQVVVLGDISPVVLFGGYEKPRQQVSWAGQSSVDYFCEKASIGLVGRELVWERKAEVMLDQLAWHDVADDADSDRRDGDPRHPQIGEAMGMVRNGDDLGDVVRHLYEEDVFDAELAGDLGMVPTTRVFYAMAACKRLHELLVAQEAASATAVPQC